MKKSSMSEFYCQTEFLDNGAKLQQHTKEITWGHPVLVVCGFVCFSAMISLMFIVATN